MAIETKMTMGELGANISTASYLLGQIVGHEIVSRKLNVKAGEAFVAGQNKLAVTYRNLAQEILEWSCEERKPYDSTWRKKRHDAFAALDELDAQTIAVREKTHEHNLDH